MRESTPSRRQVLETLGVAVAGGLAGCTSDGASTETPAETATPTPTAGAGTLPSYADFVPEGDGPVLFTMFDLEIEGGHQITTVPEEPSDPLRTGSVGGAYVEYLTGLFMQYLSYPFEVSRLDTANRERVLNVNGVAVQELPVELSAAVADAEDADEAAIQFEADDRAVVAGSTGTTFGLTTDALVVPIVSEQADTDQLVRDIVDARAGAATPRHESDDTFATLLREEPTTGSLACGYAPNSDLASTVGESASFSVAFPTEGFESASGALFRIDLDNGAPPQPASGRLQYPEDATVDTDSLSSLGSAAADRELTQDGQTVRVTGEYSWDALSEFEPTSES